MDLGAVDSSVHWHLCFFQARLGQLVLLHYSMKEPWIDGLKPRYLARREWCSLASKNGFGTVGYLRYSAVTCVNLENLLDWVPLQSLRCTHTQNFGLDVLQDFRMRPVAFTKAFREQARMTAQNNNAFD